MIPLFKVHTPPGIGAVVQEVFDSGMIAEGVYVERFEAALADKLGRRTVAVNSCTSALALVARLLNIKPGDEVITTAMTCMATNEPFFNAGAKLVFADVDPTTGNIDPNDVERCITPKTRAIVAVHWAGQPADCDALARIADDEGLPLVYDAAHAFGAQYAGRPVAAYGDFVCYSFQAIKHLTTGDGGALSCRLPANDDLARKLRWFGLDRGYTGGSRWEQDIVESGYKYHMNNISAAIGLAQMPHVDGIIERHRANSTYFDENIDSPRVEKLRRDPNALSSCWIYSLLVDDPAAFKWHATNHGVATDVVHVRNDRYSIFSAFRRDLPGLASFASRLIHIPVGWWLGSGERNQIVSMVNSFR